MQYNNDFYEFVYFASVYLVYFTSVYLKHFKPPNLRPSLLRPAYVLMRFHRIRDAGTLLADVRERHSLASSGMSMVNTFIF